MIVNLITGAIGIIALSVFLGVIAWWIKELPLTLICIAVVGMLLYDFVQTLRFGERRTDR